MINITLCAVPTPNAIDEKNTKYYRCVKKDGIWVGVTPRGGYIGTLDLCRDLASKDIAPCKIPGWSHCSIGFCEREQKWYGWSRGFYGFGIGSRVKPGDVAFVPATMEDAVADALRWYDDDLYSDVKVTQEGGSIRVQYCTHPEGREPVCYNITHRPKIGRGEWVAKTLDDAKQMAIDFAEGGA